MKDILNRLNGELLEQPFAPHDGQLRPDDLTPYRDLARHYARIEGAVAVLSDLRANTSLVCYGACARMLGLKGTREGADGELLDSIWEREILDRILNPIAVNRASYAVVFDYAFFPRGKDTEQQYQQNV